MDSEKIRRLRTRQLTGAAAAIWALLAMGLSIFSLISPRPGPQLPVRTSIIAGVAVIHAMSEPAARAGFEEGDQLLSIDGIPAIQAIFDPVLESGKADTYQVLKPDGSVLSASLVPVRDGEIDDARDALLQAGLLLVSALYLGVAISVWWTRPRSHESWPLLLYCSTMSVLLSSAIRVDVIPWAPTRVLATLPFLGATTFHLFTTYPVEPRWIRKRRRIRAIPYVIATLILISVVTESAMNLTPTWIASAAFVFGVSTSIASLAILALGREQARREGRGDRADLMLIAGLVSFLPALLALSAEWLVPTAMPWYLALLWVGVFPVAVGYAMVRRQKIEFRLAPRSSAAYGVATLAITGLYALTITFADELVARYGVNTRNVQVLLLFLAILAFNPLRERLQGLVDRFFDRDRSRYRLAVGEISEAMVSMLSLEEIGDRILLALTDTMGVSRAMVMLFDETDRVLRPAAWRGDWDAHDVETGISSDHPIWKSLWMRREELDRKSVV